MLRDKGEFRVINTSVYEYKREDCAKTHIKVFDVL